MGEPDDPSLLDRIYSWAKTHASDRSPLTSPPRRQQSILPTVNEPSQAQHNPEHDLPSTARAQPQRLSEKSNVETFHDSASSRNDSGDSPSAALPPPAPPPQDTEKDDGQSTTLTPTEKPSWPDRAKAGSKRFINHTKDAIFHSWINVLLIFVPIGIAMAYAPLPEKQKPTIVFAMNAVAIIPLAGLLSHATESVASRMGDTLASLLNVTFGNAVELIIFILALAKNQITIVQASILGSILANLLLILGMAFLLGGLRYREQIYNNTVTQMSAVLLSLAVTSLLLPTAFHASFADNDNADAQTIKISRGTCVVLLLVYILYLLFQLKSHAYMYESTPQRVIDEESHPGFLADIMNSSSSDTSSSSSSSDSDSSEGSHKTAKSRIKRAFRHRRRRKSSAASSTAATSSVSSPSTIPEVTPEPQGTSGHYFESSGRHRRDTNFSAVFSGDEADTDGEHDRGLPRVRDFEAEQPEAPSSVPSVRHKHKKHRKKKSKKSKKAQEDQAKGNLSASPEAMSPNEKSKASVLHVGFADQKVAQTEPVATSASPRRPFAITRQSFRPPLPSVFKDTVFTTPAPPPQGQPMPPTLSIVRGQLRRTNSLPDRLSRQTSRPHGADSGVAPEQRAGAMIMNEADALAKDDEVDGKPAMSRTAAIMLLLISTGLVAFCAELLVDAIPHMIENTNVSQAFIGLIILPIVGNAAEHVTAVAVALKNKMDLAIGIAVGSSIQIALFITPVVVLLGWIMNKDMSLYFNLFETVSLFVTAFVVNFLVLDGRSNYLEGSLLIAAYIIIAVAAFFYPSVDKQSLLGGA